MSFQVVKENQILHKGDRIIDSDNEFATLADVNIFAGDQVIVRDSEIHENRDIAGKLFDSAVVAMWFAILLCYSNRLHRKHANNLFDLHKVEILGT